MSRAGKLPELAQHGLLDLGSLPDMNHGVADLQINIKGLVCPHTFVRAKLALEAIEISQTLAIVLDYQNAVASVVKSMEKLGQRVLKADKINETDWLIVIEKTRE